MLSSAGMGDHIAGPQLISHKMYAGPNLISHMRDSSLLSRPSWTTWPFVVIIIINLKKFLETLKIRFLSDYTLKNNR